MSDSLVVLWGSTLARPRGHILFSISCCSIALSRAILIVCRNTNVSLHTRWPWKWYGVNVRFLSEFWALYFCVNGSLWQSAWSSPIRTVSSCSLVSCRHSSRVSWSINAVNWVEHGMSSSSLHEHPLVRNPAILLCSSSLVSSCSTIISPMSNPTLQTMRKPHWPLLQCPWRQTHDQKWWMSRAS